MSTHQLTNVHGRLSLHAYYEVQGVDPIPHWRGKHEWVPTHVNLTLDVSKTFGPTVPQPGDITTRHVLGVSSITVHDITTRHVLGVSSITVHGVKIKKDGKPGLAEVTEDYYDSKRLPDWLKAIVDETLLGLLA